MKFIGKTNEYLLLQTLEDIDFNIIHEQIEGDLTILWFISGVNELIIDSKKHVFTKDQIVFLTEFHKVKIGSIGKIRYLRFNRPFFCVIDHDSEVGCKGLLFFGASQLPVIQIPTEVLEQFETLWKMFSIEMGSNDNLQIYMLQMMLKRYLILCTRLFKIQASYPNEKIEIDIVREFNFLVEQHFKTIHSVSEYANLLNKSPKTISNVFSKIGAKTPLQYIQKRRILEAKRLLSYSNKQIQEIAFEIGFDDLQAFSRFFRNQIGVSPSTYRASHKLEKLPTL